MIDERLLIKEELAKAETIGSEWTFEGDWLEAAPPDLSACILHLLFRNMGPFRRGIVTRTGHPFGPRGGPS